MLVETLIVVIILLLVAIILLSAVSFSRQRKLRQELDSRNEEVRILREANETLQSDIGIKEKHFVARDDLFHLVRDLEGLRAAIAGSEVSKKLLLKKYGAEPGMKLFERILKARPNIDDKLKNRLADEILVGESGRTLMKSLDAGTSIEKAADEAGMPLSVAKGQVTRLRTLEYLDSRLKPTARGRKALV